MDYAGRGTKKVEGLLTVCGDSRLNNAVPRGQEKERNIREYTGIYGNIREYIRNEFSRRKGTSYTSFQKYSKRS